MRIARTPELTLFGLLISSCAATQPRPHAEGSVKIAAVHFAPEEGNVAKNIAALVALTEEAAKNGAQIVVHTEMATSGYSFFSREEIARVAETIPGPSTARIGEVAERHGIYVVLGLPEHDPRRGLYYNSAALIDPSGAVAGVYRKRNNLLEASYNAEVVEAVPIFDTPYGRIGIVICADMFYAHFPRMAALGGADLLLAPANVGVTIDFLRVRTFENDFAMVVANRFGAGSSGAKKAAFTQDSFAIPFPFPPNFNYDTRSVVMTHDGRVLGEIAGTQPGIAYGELPIRRGHRFPVVRRPELYGLIAQDTLEKYTFSQLQLPAAKKFRAAAVDPGPAPNPWDAAAASAKRVIDAHAGLEPALRLIVFPANYLPAGEDTALKLLASKSNVDLVIHFQVAQRPISRLITSTGETYDFVRLHRGRDEALAPAKLGDDYWVIDRDYARLALVQDLDLLAPETAMVLAKMGVDVVAINADFEAAALGRLLRSRTGDYLHLVAANRSGPEAIYLGGYIANPSEIESEGAAILELDTGHVRDKKAPRFIDATRLLEPCTPESC